MTVKCYGKPYLPTFLIKVWRSGFLTLLWMISAWFKILIGKVIWEIKFPTPDITQLIIVTGYTGWISAKNLWMLTFTIFMKACTLNQKSKMSSFKSNENTLKKENGSHYVVSLIKPHQWPCYDPATKARGNILQLCEFHKGSRLKDWYKSKWGPNN